MSMVCVLATVSCSTSKNSNDAKVVDAHTSQNSLDWEGTYAGKILLKEKVDAQIKLASKGTYELNYTDAETGPQKLLGMFDWNRQGTEITLKNTPKGNIVLKVGENMLMQDDSNVLRKIYIDNQLTEQYWKLTEIMGVDIKTMGTLQSEPHLIFKRDNGLVNGSLSCNNVFGGYTVASKGQISFGNLASTRMLCENMKIEDGLNYYYQKVSHYKVDDNTLILMDAEDGKPLLKYENVKMK